METLAWMAIPLSRGLYALVDGEDYSVLSPFTWQAAYNWNKSGFYARRRSKGKHIYMHRQIMDSKFGDGLQIDHKNHNSLDNRRANLRFCSNAENQYNRQVHIVKTSPFRGVSKQKGKWAAAIKYNGRSTRLGYFNSEIEAAKAYDKKAEELFGEFARTNF